MGLCTGNYVCQLDSDDVLEQNALAELKKVLDQHPTAGLVFSKFRTIDTQGSVIEEEPAWWPVPSGKKEMQQFMFNKGICVSHCRMFRRKLLEKIGPIPADLPNAADYDLYLKCMEKTGVIHYPRTLYNYRVHEENTTKKRFNLVYSSALLAKTRSARRRLARLDRLISSSRPSPLLRPWRPLLPAASERQQRPSAPAQGSR